MFTDDTTVYVEKPMTSTKNLKEYKINIQKPTVLLYTSNEQGKTDVKNIKSLIITQKLKYLDVNLSKYVQDYKTKL